MTHRPNPMLMVQYGFDRYKRERHPAQFLFDVQFHISKDAEFDADRAEAYWLVNDVRTEILFGSPLSKDSAVPSAEVLFRVQREFDHALQQPVGGQTGEVLVHQFLYVKAADVAQLQRLVAQGVNEIAVGVVDNDQVSFLLVARAPQLSRRALKGVGRQPLSAP